MTEARSPQRRRTVATRVLLSYLIVMVAFALVTGWSVIAQRQAAREADLMRDGYLPLALALQKLGAHQDTWNTQLNHITAAKNPADIRMWLGPANIGWPYEFAKVREAISRAFSASEDPAIAAIGGELVRELASIEQSVTDDGEKFKQLFVAIDKRDTVRAERLRDELAKRGFESKRRLQSLEARVKRNVDNLVRQADHREQLAIRLLIALASLTMLVGVAMALYARRVLKPLAAVTERAKSVAEGDLTPRPVVASNDEIGELAATFESMVSAIARANEQLLSAERLATIGKMAAHVTHEIRNPLSSIALNLELLEEELAEKEDSEALTLLRAIGAEVERLTALSEQYLSVARRQPIRLEQEDIAEVVREAAEFMRRDLSRQDVGLQLDIDSDLPSVDLDEGQLKQALFNLIRNAREAIGSGGTVSISLRREAGGGIQLKIEDDGPGIEEAARSRLFEPFFTTKKHGTGLGLPITRQIVEAHAGTISCAARPEGGTCISIRLPPSKQVPYSETETEMLLESRSAQ